MNRNTIFSPEELKEYEHIKEKVTSNKYSVENPTAIVLGGQPGAGKSNIYKIARNRFENNIVELDIDKFRQFHPNAEELAKVPETYGEKTNPFVSAVVDCLVEELGKEKYNMIIESPMKSSRTASWIYDTLKPNGYTVEAHVMATPKEVSWQGIIDRYNAELADGVLARIVPKEFHDFVVENITQSLSEVYKSGKMSNIFVFNRAGDILYDMQKTPNINPSSILDNVINQTRNNSEKIAIKTSKLLKPDLYFLEITSPEQIEKLEKSGIAFELNPRKTIAAVAKVDKEKALECLSKLDKPKLKR